MERRQPLEALRRPHRSTPRPARRVRRALLHLGGMFVAAPGLLLALGAHPAAAASTGTCTATIAGTPAAQTSVDSPVKVRPDAKVVVS